MPNPKVCVLRAAGTNCDAETASGFLKAGASTELVHINRLVNKEKSLSDYQILAIPGGFSYGDDIASGKIFANELKYKLKRDIQKFVGDGKLIIGICNGFQILVKSGLLPGNAEFDQDSSLIINDSGKFEDRWVYLKSYDSGQALSRCIWTNNLEEIIYLPVAHGEGKFVTRDKTILEKLKQNRQIVFQYCNLEGDLAGYPDNPNGSQENIAGICDDTGRIFGLMPHPERHVDLSQHPRWTGDGSKKQGDGLAILKNGVDYARKNL